MKNMNSTLISLGILAALLLIGWQMFNNENDAQDVEITVIEQIKKVARLQTIDMKVATTLKKTKTGKIGPIKKTGKRTTTYFAEGTVTASIDLEKMDVALDKEKNLVTITLPKDVVVSNPTHDNFEITCSHWEKGFVKKFTDRERSKHSNEAFANIKQKAEDAGIRSKAKAQAKLYLTTFVNALGREVAFK